MVNKVFKDLLGNTMEAYVDDMIVKSTKEESHIEELKNVFNVMRKYNMRLNPSKCSFGVSTGKFLKFMTTQWGIEVNPKNNKSHYRNEVTCNDERSTKVDEEACSFESLSCKIDKT